MNILTSDFEVTTHAKGNPFSKKNKAVCLGYKHNDSPTICEFEVDTDFLCLVDVDLCVFFNAKFDLHWYRRYGYALPKNIWCCQLAEFILSRQTIPYPSLEDTAQKYGLGHKIDIIKTEYWDKGIDTDAIPTDILSNYCKQDVDLTYSIYLRQQEIFIQKPGLYKLFKLACQDLLILEEMEWNGLVYSEDLCTARIEECQEKMQTHISALNSVYPNVPINFNSGDQLSAFLYGGTIVQDIKLPDGVYKGGLKKGQPKFKNSTIEHQLPRMVEPLPKTELVKPGLWATNEPTLKKLKGPFAKKYVEHILGVAKQDKLIGTYYAGLPKQNKEMDWEPGKIHGQLNQCVAATGRLSASKPNQQNFAAEIQDIFVSRYD